MGRAPCCEKIGLKTGRWSSEEDDKLSNYISIHGEGSWRSLPKNAGLKRCGKSCRLRWINYLRADVKRGNISKEEEDKIINLHSTLGNRWSLIASHLDGRTDNEIKNHWNTHLSKRFHKIDEIHDDGRRTEVVTRGLGTVSSNNKPHKIDKIYRSLKNDVTNSNNKVSNSLNSSEHDVGNKSEQNKPNSEFSCVSDELWAMNDDIVSGPERPNSSVGPEENMPNIDLSWPNIECPNVEYPCPNKEDIVVGAFNSGLLFDELTSWSNYDMDNLFDNNVIHEEENIEGHESRESCWGHIDEAQIWDWANLDLWDGVVGDTCVGFDDLW